MSEAGRWRKRFRMSRKLKERLRSLRVGPSVVTARLAWTEADADRILSFFEPKP